MANLKSNAVVGRCLMAEMCTHTRNRTSKPDLAHGIDCLMYILLNRIQFLLIFSMFVTYRYPPVMAVRMDDDEDMFYQQVRYLQRKTRCSDAVCKEFIKIFQKFSPGLLQSCISGFDRKAKKFAGCEFIILHGCPNCDRHVYKPTDPEGICPVCGHPRFDVKGKALEVFVCVCVFLTRKY